jgi:hypothetical protein
MPSLSFAGRSTGCPSPAGTTAAPARHGPALDPTRAHRQCTSASPCGPRTGAAASVSPPVPPQACARAAAAASPGPLYRRHVFMPRPLLRCSYAGHELCVRYGRQALKLLQLLHEEYMPAARAALGPDAQDDPYLFGVTQMLTSHTLVASCPSWGQWQHEPTRPPCSCHGRVDPSQPPAELRRPPTGRDMPAIAEASIHSQ